MKHEFDDFKFWLENQDPSHIIAENWDCSSCPITQWLRTLYPDKEVSVYYDGSMIADETPDQLDRHFIDFLRYVDRKYKWIYGSRSGGTITAAQCLSSIVKIS